MRNRNVPIILLLLTVLGCASTPKEPGAELIGETTSDAPQLPSYAAGAVRLFEQANRNREAPEEAEAKYLQAVAIDPSMEPAWFNLARLYYDTAAYSDLSELIENASIQPVLSARLLNLLGTSQRKTGQFMLAAETYQKALQIDATHLASLANYAILLDIYLHNPEAALPWYEEYQNQLQLQGKEDPRVKNWIADVTQRISRGVGG